MHGVAVAVWSFRDPASAAEAVSQLERAGIPGSALSQHDNLAGNTWLFVPEDRASHAKEVIRTLPEFATKGAIELVGIGESDLSTYAARYGKRLDRAWAAWLVIFLWPFGFGLGFWVGAASFLAYGVAVLVMVKKVFVCPCCRKPVDIWTMHYVVVPCSWCGITPGQTARSSWLVRFLRGPSMVRPLPGPPEGRSPRSN